MVVCKQAVYRSSPLWWGYTESSIILCSACQHASLTVLVLFRYSCHISHVLSLGPIQGKKKKKTPTIYIRRIMCFEKPCDIRIWLVCTNRYSSNIIGTHTHTHTHIYLFTVHCGVNNTVSPMAGSLFRWGWLFQPECTQVFTDVSRAAQTWL